MYSSDFARASLVLGADQTYVEVYVPTKGARQECRGRWAWDAGSHRVTFAEGLIFPSFVAAGMTTATCQANAVIPALRGLKGLYLEEDPDSDTGQFRKR